jgi:8-oxo-dGTP diphosphatase
MLQVVCAVIEDDAGRILACRRPQGKSLGGLWEFPGGKIEEGESPAAALQRELREELSIEVDVGPPLQPVIWHYDFGTIQLLPFRCRILSGQPSPVEHEEIRWCSQPDMDALQWAPADLPILDELRSFKSAGLPQASP